MRRGAALNDTCGCFFVHDAARNGELGTLVCLVRMQPESPAVGLTVVVTWLGALYSQEQ